MRHEDGQERESQTYECGLMLVREGASTREALPCTRKDQSGGHTDDASTNALIERLEAAAYRRGEAAKRDEITQLVKARLDELVAEHGISSTVEPLARLYVELMEGRT
jgi:hypothetical protein